MPCQGSQLRTQVAQAVGGGALAQRTPPARRATVGTRGPRIHCRPCPRPKGFGIPTGSCSWLRSPPQLAYRELPSWPQKGMRRACPAPADPLCWLLGTAGERLARRLSGLGLAGVAALEQPKQTFGSWPDCSSGPRGGRRTQPSLLREPEEPEGRLGQCLDFQPNGGPCCLSVPEPEGRLSLLA